MAPPIESGSDRAAARLAALAARVETWLFEAAFPLWSSAGFDDATGAFVERLELSGVPDRHCDRRVRVQARQIYAFATARELGWRGPAEDRVARSFDYLTGHAWRPDGGWAHLLSPGGEIRDGRLDLYDQAFVLFAFAAVARTLGRDVAGPWIERTMEALDRDLRLSRTGGYRESVPDALPRRSNPHMHLLEAFLALYAATGEMRFLERATAIVELFRTSFYDRGAGVLREFFAADLNPWPGRDGDWVEPGHHFEWAWLLDRYAAAAGTETPPEAAKLTAFAERHGRDRSGYIVDVLYTDGSVRDPARRCWPQTESLKANLVRCRRGDEHGLESAALTVELLFRSYLDVVPAGGWMDRFDENERPLSKHVPASTLYHLVCAFAELLAAARP